MSLWNTLWIAVRALRRNAMRTALTALGMIIGVAAVIVMVAIGAGAKASIEDQIKSAGTNIVTVNAGAGFGPVRGGQGATTTLTVEDGVAVRRDVAGIRYLSPGLNTRTQVISEGANWNTQVQGTSEDLPAIRSWPMQYGLFFTAEDVARAAKVVVLGSVARDQLFGQGADPTGATIRLRNQPFKVIGVLASKGQSAMPGQDQDDTAVIPYTTMQKRVLGVQHVSSLTISAADGVDQTAMTASIAGVLRQRHRIQPGQDDDFSVRTMEEFASMHDVHDHDDDLPAGEHRGGLAAGRGHRHHEHHARVGHRADARDRLAPVGGRPRSGRAAAVPGRSDRPVAGWWRHRRGGRVRDVVGGAQTCCTGPRR